jgi:drug/metabolite transporter (DMT)-like permease
VLGFFIVLLSSIVFCFQNVIVRVIFNEHTVIRIFQTGGFVAPSLQYSFLLMFMRTLLAVPLMAILSPRLYPPTWQTIAQLSQPNQRTVLWRSLAGGVFMFLYLALLYVSIGLIPTGIALTLFFTYPVFTALLSWKMFGDRPTLFRWSVMAGVMLGGVLTLPSANLTTNHSNLMGILTGIASGITYALYSVNAQKSFEQMNPVPFTLMSFATTLVLSGLSFLLWNIWVWDVSHAPIPWVPLWIAGFLSAIVTMTAHLLNNFGIQLIGATSASMVAASNPTLTVILAWLTIQETLQGAQILGVAIATLSVFLLSYRIH